MASDPKDNSANVQRFKAVVEQIEEDSKKLFGAKFRQVMIGLLLEVDEVKIGKLRRGKTIPTHVQIARAVQMDHLLRGAQRRLEFVKEKNPVYSMWTSYPYHTSRGEEQEHVVSELVRLIQINLRKQPEERKLPKIFVSPVDLGTVDVILTQTMQRIHKKHPHVGLRDLIGGIVLKTIKPSLAQLLIDRFLMVDRRQDFEMYGNQIAFRAQSSFLPRVDPAGLSNWISVRSYWSILPPWHGLYVEDCDWIHLGPWMADSSSGKLGHDATCLYRISTEIDEEGFNRARDLLTQDGDKSDELPKEP